MNTLTRRVSTYFIFVRNVSSSFGSALNIIATCKEVTLSKQIGTSTIFLNISYKLVSVLVSRMM